MAELPSGTVTFLFTDIEGSTRLWEEHRAAMGVALARHDAIVEDAITDHGGVVFSKMGDGMAAAFASPNEAIAAVVTAQLNLAEATWPEATGPLLVRMGAHTGEGVLVDGQYMNQPLNRCARLMAIAHGGQVVVSGTTEPLLREALPEGVGLVDLGEHRLRDLSEPLRVFEIRHPALHSEFPPLRSLDAFPGNLPIQLSSFVGRHRELARVIEALHDARQVTLTGVGGVGKTRLALQVAAEIMPRFREGAWLVELAAVRDPAGVPDAFAAVFGVTPRSGQSVAEALVDFLRTKELLVVVDNCEHLLDAVASLIEALERACHGLVVLGTSREGLALEGERILAVPSLSSPEADADLETIAAADSVVLFVERAQRVDADFVLSRDNASAVAQVCTRLDGVPLAIELAAARVTTMTPRELAQGLDHRFEVLAGGRRGAVQRHQTLRAAIDWSYGLCSDAERRLLMRLSVFSGGATREAIEVVCSAEPIEARRVFELLSGLVAKSLVIAQRDRPGTRYRLLETIREYGEERLAEVGETEALRATHAEYYCEFVSVLSDETLGPRQIEAARRLEAERENLLAAMQHALDLIDVDLALRLLRSVPPATFQLGTPIFLPAKAILSLPGASDHSLFPHALAVMAVQEGLRGDPSAVEAACQEALGAVQQASSDPERQLVELMVTNARGTRAMSLGAMADSAKYWDQSTEIARAARRLEWLPGSLGTAALMHTMAGDTDAAVPLATEGLDLARQVGRPTQIVMNLAVLAGALVERDPQRSRVLLDESLQLRASLGFEGYADTSQITFTAAQMADWPLVLQVAPLSIRTLHWSVQRPSLAGILNVVARALVGSDPEAAAVLQGVAHHLIVANTPAPMGIRPSSAPGRVASGQVSGPTSFVTKVRRETTALLDAVLGEGSLRERRAVGEAMDEDRAVAYALDAIARALTMTSS